VYELVQDLTAKGGANGGPGGGEKTTVSLLAAAALRSCLKAISSARMTSGDKSAICSYVAGELDLVWARYDDICFCRAVLIPCEPKSRYYYLTCSSGTHCGRCVEAVTGGSIRCFSLDGRL